MKQYESSDSVVQRMSSEPTQWQRLPRREKQLTFGKDFWILELFPSMKTTFEGDLEGIDQLIHGENLHQRSITLCF